MKEKPFIINSVDKRYHRQCILEGFGIRGQELLRKAKVLIVGMGGLGCPCALYLSSAGIGKLGLVDGDIVEKENLHRQILHLENRVGLKKVESARIAIREANNTVECICHDVFLTVENALSIIKEYDLVVDATDNVNARYIISDSCVSLNKPIISGAALGIEGQLTVYNYKGGPCYRCINPKPPKKVLTCDTTGVLGPMVGMIGCMQALEVIKILIGKDCLAGKMLFYNGITHLIRVACLRKKNKDCPCNKNTSFLQKEKPFTCSENKNIIFNQENRITWEMYREFCKQNKPHVLIDVREENEYELTRVSDSINIPLSILEEKISYIKQLGKEKDIYVLCRRGVRSKTAVDILSKKGIKAKDLIGGIDVF